MAERERWWAPGRAEQVIGTLLRIGVLAAALIVLAAGLLYLARHGAERPDVHAFHGEPQDLRRLGGIVGAAATLHARALIQLGLLLLIATPVARVALSVAVFALEGDRVYVAVTLAVLGLLLYSLLASG